MFCRILLFAAVGAGLLQAQLPRGFFAWWDSPIARDLNLRDDQRVQIRSTVREYRTRLIDQRAAVERAEAELEALFDQDQVDQKKTLEAIDRLAVARADLTRSFSQMSLRLRVLLSDEQWRELQRRRPIGPNPPKNRRLAAPESKQPTPGS